jgi:hypothetical protein
MVTLRGRARHSLRRQIAEATLGARAERKAPLALGRVRTERGACSSQFGLLRRRKSPLLGTRARSACEALVLGSHSGKALAMLRAGLFLGFAVLYGCGSTDASPSSSSAGSSAGGSTAAAGATQGGSAGTLSSAGASSGGSSSGGGAAGAANAGGTGAGGTGSVGCNTLANSAPVVHEMVIKGDPPAPAGGTITDGTYYETSYVVYTSSSSEMPSTTAHQLTAQISGSTFQAVFLDETNTEQRLTLQLMPNGTMLSEHQTCRTNTKFMMNDFNLLGYDATPTTFTIHQLQDPLSLDYVVYTLTKQ